MVWQESFQLLGEAGTRGHTKRIRRELTKKTLRFNFFKNRVIEEWNDFTQEVVDSRSTNNFKNKYDNFILKKQAVTV